MKSNSGKVLTAGCTEFTHPCVGQATDVKVNATTNPKDQLPESKKDPKPQTSPSPVKPAQNKAQK